MQRSSLVTLVRYTRSFSFTGREPCCNAVSPDCLYKFLRLNSCASSGGEVVSSKCHCTYCTFCTCNVHDSRNGQYEYMQRPNLTGRDVQGTRSLKTDLVAWSPK